MWKNKILIKHETKVSEASISFRQSIIRDFNELHFCLIREWRLFKHYDNHEQIVKRCFTDNATEFRDWNSNSKFYKECLFTLWNIFSDYVRLKQLIYQWVLSEILWNSQHSMLTIYCVSLSDWWIHWENEQCYQINVESFQQLGPDKLNSFITDDIINNKKLCYLCNRSLSVFTTL